MVRRHRQRQGLHRPDVHLTTNQSKNVDTTKTTTHVSLCAGYGGIDIGLGRAIPNLRTVAFSEIEAFACANLVAKMEAGLLDAAPIWTNLKTFPWSEFRDRVDILSGGYPCQPFSAAGKRLGREDPRHLWPWIADGIVSMRPRICFFENVEGHVSLGLREVIGELEGLGYKVAWGIFSAREVGAPHQRKRVFILAHLCSEGLEGLRERCDTQGWQAQIGHTGSSSDTWPSQTIELANTSDSPDPARGYAEADRLSSEHRSAICSGELRGADATAWPSRPGQPQHGWEPPRVVGDAESIRSTARRAEHEGLSRELCAASSGGEGAVGDTEGWQDHGRESGDLAEESGCGTGGDHAADCTGEGVGNTADERSSERRSREVPESRSKQEAERSDASPERQAEPSLGGDSDGSADWLDDAELYITSDNRTDELRLLGNGVVPATATRAFLTLMDQLLSENP